MWRDSVVVFLFLFFSPFFVGFLFGGCLRGEEGGETRGRLLVVFGQFLRCGFRIFQDPVAEDRPEGAGGVVEGVAGEGRGLRKGDRDAGLDDLSDMVI